MSFLGDLFSLNSSPARYRFENKSPKYSGAKARIISWIASHTLAMTQRNTSKVKRCNNNGKNSSPLTVHRLLINETVFSRFTSHFSLPQPPAFTLAEVLITLGIIGIVAAMTLPSLLNNLQNKHLETAFKKAYTMHSQALIRVKEEMGVDNLYEEFRYYDKENGLYPREEEFKNAYYNKLKIIGHCKYSKPIRNYNNTANAYVTAYTSNEGDNSKPVIMELSDGTCCRVRVSSGRINIVIDINGAGARPNKMGHDIFVFYVNEKGLLEPAKTSKVYTNEELEQLEGIAVIAQAGEPCSINSTQGGNGMGCAWFAFNNINPDTNEKGYWNNLPK